MQYESRLIGLSSLIEEEAILDINGQKFVVFINNCPFEINLGGKYLIETELVILDDLTISKSDSEEKCIEQIEDSFAYSIRGILNVDSGTIDAGILFEVDRELLFDYGYLHNQYVQMRVDRLSVDFIG